MSDCNHESIKCMKCHRYVGIHEQVIPIAPAIARIKELEMEVLMLKAQLEAFKLTDIKEIHHEIGGLQHECT